jgi:hypothetical protein
MVETSCKNIPLSDVRFYFLLQTWLSDDPVHVEIGNVIPATVSVAKRIRLATRMNVFTYNGGEPFQVTLYTVKFG